MKLASWNLGDFTLESGEVIKDARMTWIDSSVGESNEHETVLILPAIGGQSLNYDFLIGPERAFDPGRYRIICVDAFGNGLAASPSNSRHQPGQRFPRFTVGDIARAQHALVRDRLGIEQLDIVAGISMGGMQALEWGVRFPHAMRQLIPIVPLYRTPPHTRCVNEVLRRCLMSDPGWKGGNYDGPLTTGLSLMGAVQFVHVCQSPEGINALAQQAGAVPEAIINPWIKTLLERKPDAWDWIYQSWAYDDHDVARAGDFDGDSLAALASIKARTLIIHAREDYYNPPGQAREAAEHIPGARAVEVPSDMGHWSVGPRDPEGMRFTHAAIRQWLSGEG